MWVHVMVHALDRTDQPLSNLETQRKLKVQHAWWRPGKEKGRDLSYPVLGLEKLTNPSHTLDCVPFCYSFSLERAELGHQRYQLLQPLRLPVTPPLCLVLQHSEFLTLKNSGI